MGDPPTSDSGSNRKIRAYRAYLGRLARKARAAGRSSASPLSNDDRYRTLLESLKALTVDIGPDGRISHTSDSVRGVLGYDPAELIGRDGLDWVHSDDLLGDRPDALQLRESGKSFRGEFRGRHKDGHWVWLEVSAAIAERPTTGPPCTVVFARDITEEKLAHDALLESESRLRALTDHAADIISEVDIEGRIHYVSPSFRAALGREPDEIIGKTFAEIGIVDHFHPDDIGNLNQRYERGMGRGDAARSFIAYRFRHANGTWRWFESQTAPYTTQKGDVRKVVISRDVTERVQAEAELRESEERYRILGETSRDLICELDGEGTIQFVSAGSEKILGHSPESLMGTTGFTLIHPDDIERSAQGLKAVLEDDGPIRSEPYRVRHRDGSWRWVEGVGVPYRRADGSFRILTVARDVTDRIAAEEQRERLEEHLRHAQKLEGLGVMAGGIAHDFNNLLTPILGNASLALLDLPPDSPVRERIEKIHRAALRAASLTNQMLAYAGAGPVATEALDLSKTVREMSQLLDSSISGHARAEYALDPHLPLIDADEAQISQVVMNLLTNAAEAVGEGGGEITVTTGTIEIDAESGIETVLGEALPEGTFVYFAVRDTGNGMDSETRSRIFDPFFTTKFTGRGLGLAAVLGAVRGHGGAIEIDSQLGVGTLVRVLFPLSGRPPAKAVTETSPVEQWHGTGTVLVVDDDEGVRDLAKESLERAGLSVLTARDGREGIETFRRFADEIRAVFLDRTMPDISGEQAFDAPMPESYW